MSGLNVLVAAGSGVLCPLTYQPRAQKDKQKNEWWHL